MKSKVLGGALVWLVLISLLHVQLNVGWTRVARNTRVFFGADRTELVVGFLPVT